MQCAIHIQFCVEEKKCKAASILKYIYFFKNHFNIFFMYIPDNLVLLLQVSRGEIHSLVDIRMSSYGTSSYKVWTVVAALKRRRRSIDEAIALRRC